MIDYVYKPIKVTPKKLPDGYWEPDELQIVLDNIADRFNDYSRRLKEAQDYVEKILDNFYADIGVDLVDLQANVWSRGTKITDKDGTSTGSGFLYFIQNDDTKDIKIGVSNDVKSRLNTLQTSNGSPLSIIGTIEFMDKSEAFRVEKELHTYFEAFRKSSKKRKTEWFREGIKPTVQTILNDNSFLSNIYAANEKERARFMEVQKRFADAWNEHDKQSGLLDKIKDCVLDKDGPMMMKLQPASKKYGISYDRLRKMCLAGEVNAIRTGRDILINTKSLEEKLCTSGLNEEVK